MNLVVAVDKNWAIGYKGDLLAHVRADLKEFSRLTTGHAVVLGSKTLSTFPGGKVLKNRTNIVLSSRTEYNPEGAIMARSMDELKKILENYDTDDVFVIGGASVYKELLPLVDVCYVTKFDKAFEADAYFPNLDDSGEWELVYKGREQISDPEKDTETGLKFFFTKYRRKT